MPLYLKCAILTLFGVAQLADWRAHWGCAGSVGDGVAQFEDVIAQCDEGWLIV